MKLGFIVAIIILPIVSGITTSILASLLEKHFETQLGKWPKFSIFVLLALSLAAIYFTYVASESSKEPDALSTLETLETIEAQQATIIANFSSQTEDESGVGIQNIGETEALVEFIELGATKNAIISTLPQTVEPVTPISTSVINFPSLPSLNSTFVREADNMEMLFVPGGTYLMGSVESDPNAEPIERPQHRVTINGFWIDTTEVTNSQYGQFLNSIIQDSAQLSIWIEIDSEYSQISHNNEQFEVDQSVSNSPVVMVSWYGADAYCNWAGGRLPAEEEWEYAARGPNSPIYPWGNNFDGTVLNFCDVNCPRDWRDSTYNDNYSMTAPVGSFPAGQSWIGAKDLAGNVSEWTAYGLYAYSADENWAGSEFSSITTIAEQGFHKVVRGGSWANTPTWTRTTHRAFPAPEEKSEFIGFRCAATP